MASEDCFVTNEVAVRLGANQITAHVDLGKKLEHIIELRIDEYAVRTPNGGAVTPSLWRLWIKGFYPEITTNANGRGYPIVIDNATLTHVVYTRPRVMSTQNNGEMNHLDIEIRDENGAAVTFDDATFYLTFVTTTPGYDNNLVMQQHYDLDMGFGAAHTTGIPGIDMRK